VGERIESVVDKTKYLESSYSFFLVNSSPRYHGLVTLLVVSPTELQKLRPCYLLDSHVIAPESRAEQSRNSRQFSVGIKATEQLRRSMLHYL
jgi:hypothetical protein